MSSAELQREAPSGERAAVVKGSLLSMGLLALGSLLGLIRDLILAGLFGAGANSDAFVIAWTVPETASPLLIEGAMALVMIPLFGRALAEGTDPRRVVAATLPRLLIVLVVVGAAVLVFAPALVDAIGAAGAQRRLAIDCLRLAAPTVPLIGLAGYFSAALRSHGSFGAPAFIYTAYNLGIIACMALGYLTIGVRGAALGLSAGAALMVLVQLPGFTRKVGFSWHGWRSASPVVLGGVLTVGLYTIIRQGQVFVERAIGAPLGPGTISALNYAQKVAQVPLTLSAVLAVVTFPLVARRIAAGNGEQARRRVETDLRFVGGVTLLATAFLIPFAPSVIAFLFQRGAFDAAATAATARILQVYVLGLLGQVVVDQLSRVYFAGSRPNWVPVLAMTAGLALTGFLAAALVRPWGAAGIAAANAAGITLTGLLLALAARGARLAAPRPRVYGSLALLLIPAGAALLAGFALRQALRGWPPLPTLLAGGFVSTAVFGVIVAAGWRIERFRSA
ncbi:lipid II flippase MurJ [Sciscionella sediminilitoris]|uniref:lipid II flippase MurJ n=1 Tax=Sciscionella sediminilitoris TaxID=1445613 RepID=UPI0012E15474|nr:lipid II flippase MurJ [Sciscionella sp. SE31]